MLLMDMHAARRPVSKPGWFWEAGLDCSGTCGAVFHICIPRDTNMKLPCLLIIKLVQRQVTIYYKSSFSLFLTLK